jgi:hypothetical protein
MTVAHQPLPAAIGELVGMAAEQGGNFGLDGLRQQRIAECTWLRELENINLGYGLSLLRWRWRRSWLG